jgi:hypothetical protein
MPGSGLYHWPELREPTIKQVYGGGPAFGADVVSRFFARVQLANGVFKATAPHRLDDVNTLVARFLPAERPLELMDVAVSSGVTTQEWSRQLSADGIDHHITAGDTDIDATWVSYRLADILVDATGHILYADLLGRGVRTGREFASSIVPMTLARAVLRASRLLRPRVRRVRLISPDVARNPAITVVADDLFERRPEFESRFHALRAANILNRGYFHEDTLRKGLCNLSRRIAPGGLLVVCRTDNLAVSHATVFRRDGDSLRPIARLGNGSEIESLAP